MDQMSHKYQQHSSPCFHCHPSTYIRMVQHLIEQCLILRMNRDQCIKALAEHASIRPLVTLTVWRELLKENREFFHTYSHDPAPKPYSSNAWPRTPRFGRRFSGSKVTSRNHP